MIIYPLEFSFPLIKANVIKPLKASSTNGSNTMVRHEEILLPSHEDMFALSEVLVAETGLSSLSCYGLPGGKPVPVEHVLLFRGAPGRMSRCKGVFVANYLAFEVRF